MRKMVKVNINSPRLKYYIKQYGGLKRLSNNPIFTYSMQSAYLGLRDWGMSIELVSQLSQILGVKASEFADIDGYLTKLHLK